MKWTEESVAMLRVLYPDASLAREEIEERIGRPWKQIKDKAVDLGIRRKDYWTAEEDAYVRANYRKMFARDVAKALGRSVQAVRNRANEIGASEGQDTNSKCKIRLTLEQRSLLRREYPHVATAVLASLLGISPRTVVRRAREMGLEKTEQFMREARAHMAKRAKESHLRNGTYPPKGVVTPNLAKGAIYRFKKKQIN